VESEIRENTHRSQTLSEPFYGSNTVKTRICDNKFEHMMIYRPCVLPTYLGSITNSLAHCPLGPRTRFPFRPNAVRPRSSGYMQRQWLHTSCGYVCSMLMCSLQAPVQVRCRLCKVCHCNADCAKHFAIPLGPCGWSHATLASCMAWVGYIKHISQT
jgi:hypothetical protein